MAQRSVNLKQLQTTLHRISMQEFMKLPTKARHAFEDLYDGLEEVVPKPKSKRPTQAPEGLSIPVPSPMPSHPLPGTYERPFDPFASIHPPSIPPMPSTPPPGYSEPPGTGSGPGEPGDRPEPAGP